MTDPHSGSSKSPRPPVTDLPDLITDDGDRPSITNAGGTVARFEMAYNPTPTDRFFFKASLWQKLPSLLYLGFALTIGGIALVGWSSPGTALNRWVVEGGKAPLAFIIVLTALGTSIQQMLRGVVVTREAIESRTMSMGFPRVRKWSWAQIDRLVLDEEEALLELWDGTYERLPRVAKGKELVELLAQIATARGRQVTRIER